MEKKPTSTSKQYKSYSELLKSPKWQKKKNSILDRDKYKCQHCGDEEKSLHVHHLIYTSGKKPWEYPDDCLITYCCDCHKAATMLDNAIRTLAVNQKDLFFKLELVRILIELNGDAGKATDLLFIERSNKLISGLQEYNDIVKFGYKDDLYNLYFKGGE